MSNSISKSKFLKEKLELKENKLIIKSLGKHFKNKKVLIDVSLEVSKGEVVGLLGPNGSGKTTFFHSISGILKPDYGNILLNELDISSMPIHKRARLGISYLPQESSVFRGLTVEQNIKAIIEVSQPNLKHSKLFLNELLNYFNLEHLRLAPALILSGGERRRVEIARALASQPQFLLLDEPFSGIDPIAIIEIKKIIKVLKNRGIGIIITDHNVKETLQTVDRSYILYNGRILASGDSNELVENIEVRRVYLGSKFSL